MANRVPQGEKISQKVAFHLPMGASSDGKLGVMRGDLFRGLEIARLQEA